MALLMNWEAELIKNVQGSLNTVDSETTNQKKYLDKDKTKCIDKDKEPIPRCCDDPLTPRWRLPHAVLMPLSCCDDVKLEK